MIDRNIVIETLRTELEPNTFVNAMWEGGSAAFGRLDELSDIDLMVEVAEGRTEKAVALIESALESLAPLQNRSILPQPTWHGHWQAFYRLQGSNPHLWIDVVILEQGAEPRFDEIERHGTPIVYFDKTGSVATPPTDLDWLRERIAGRLAVLADSMPLYEGLITKEVDRGNPVAAVGLYHAGALRPLVELLRIKLDPYRFDYGARYLDRDLPAEVRERLVALSYPEGPNQVKVFAERAHAWIGELLAELDADSIVRQLGDG